MVDRQTTIDQLDELLPLAAQWAAEQERHVLCEGVRLSEIELADAKAIGVRNPERVRLLRVDAVPIPAHPMLRAAAASINFLTAAPRGLAWTTEFLFAPITGAIARSLLTSWCTPRSFKDLAESSHFSRPTFSNVRPSAIRMRLWNWRQSRPQREFVPPDRNY